MTGTFIENEAGLLLYEQTALIHSQNGYSLVHPARVLAILWHSLQHPPVRSSAN